MKGKMYTYSSLCPTIQQQQQQTVPNSSSSSSSSSPAGTPVKFWEFFQTLDNVERCKNPFLAKKRRDDGSEFKEVKKRYQEGTEKLLKTTFASIDDALYSLRAVLNRSFRGLSIVSKTGKASPVHRVVCTAQEKDDTRANGRGSIKAGISLGNDAGNFKSESCHWDAYIKRNEAGPGFVFTQISDIHEHAPSCFNKGGYKHRKLIEIVSECKDLSKRTPLNRIISSKIGYYIDNKTVNEHNYFKKTTLIKQKTEEYSKVIDDMGITLPPNLEKEDKAIVGLLFSFKQEEPEFLFQFSTDDEEKKVIYLACIWPSQKEKLQNYGDLLFIDSTFNISLRNYKAINIVRLTST